MEEQIAALTKLMMEIRQENKDLKKELVDLRVRKEKRKTKKEKREQRKLRRRSERLDVIQTLIFRNRRIKLSRHPHLGQ